MIYVIVVIDDIFSLDAIVFSKEEDAINYGKEVICNYIKENPMVEDYRDKALSTFEKYGATRFGGLDIILYERNVNDELPPKEHRIKWLGTEPTCFRS